MLEEEEDSNPAMLECLSNSNQKKSKNKRRFNDEQIRSLEITFESESMIEPRKKLQLATELGLQPRQVAIWFQNKRARWKSKQLESGYTTLRANYNTLASHFQALKKENQSLVAQLQKLRDLTEKSGEEGRYCCGQALARKSSTDGRKSDQGDNINDSELEVKPSLSLDGSEHGLGVLSEDDANMKAEYFGVVEEAAEVLNMANGSLTSPENWSSLDSNGASTTHQWLDLWSCE